MQENQSIGEWLKRVQSKHQSAGEFWLSSASRWVGDVNETCLRSGNFGFTNFGVFGFERLRTFVWKGGVWLRLGVCKIHWQNDYKIEILQSLLLSANRIWAVWNLGILFWREKLRLCVILSANSAPQVVTPVWLVYRLEKPDYRKFKASMPVYQIQTWTNEIFEIRTEWNADGWVAKLSDTMPCVWVQW